VALALAVAVAVALAVAVAKKTGHEECVFLFLHTFLYYFFFSNIERATWGHFFVLFSLFCGFFARKSRFFFRVSLFFTTNSHYLRDFYVKIHRLAFFSYKTTFFFFFFFF
jgi:hypothetical protein